MARIASLALLSILTLFATSCRDTPTSGDSSVPATLDIVSGDQQEGTVGTELPAPLTVRVLNANGRPVAGQLVIFRVVEGGGTVFAGAAITDASGIARERWTLGTSTTGSQRVEARAVEAGTGNALVFGVFQATAKPGPAVSLERVTTAAVQQVVGTTAAPTPAVRAVDQYGNPVPGVAVTFAASAGGTVTGGSVTTGAAGVATVGGWTLATAPGVNTLTATATALPPISFTITGVVGAATQLTKRSTDPQVAPVATNVPVPPSIAVLDAYGNPVAGVAVTFVVTAGGGTIVWASGTTDALGTATIGSWTLGTTAGVNTLEARAAGNAVVFTATGTPGAPSSLTKLAGDNQTTEVGQQVPTAPKVRVSDQYGNVVAGTEVMFTVVSGGGTVTPQVVLTAADGSASPTSWTLGTVVGANTLSASAGAAGAVTFAATARQGQAMSLRATDPPLLVFPGTALGVVVQLDDAFGNPVPQAGVTITASIASGPGGASLTGSTATTTVTGTADFSALTLLGPDGVYSIRFTAPGITSVTSRGITVMRFGTVVGGSWHTCALDMVGAAYCWGNNQFAQLGDGTIAPNGQTLRLRPHAVSGNHRFTVLTTAVDHSCGLGGGGSAWCWGDNEQGQLGDGTTVRPLVPVAVGGGLRFVGITAGAGHTCGLTAAGVAYCWGRNVYGQLGDGTVTSRTLPTPVAGGLPFTSIRAGANYACGLVADGTAYCWGSGHAGNLGAPTTELCFDGTSNIACNRIPRPVTGGLQFSSISTGSSTTCALAMNGDAYCWGFNGGMVGDGTTVGRTTPTPVATAERFVRLLAGGHHSCGLTVNGAAFCWGDMVGDGTTAKRLVPTLVAGGHVLESLVVPTSSLGATCGITDAGTPLCWGENDYAQVGDATTIRQPSPVPVKPPQ